jgi:hypothetical protein
MPEYRRVGQELWIDEAAQCLAPPSMHMVFKGNDQRYYLVMVVELDEASCLDWLGIDRSLMRFERLSDAWTFCRLSGLHPEKRS